MPPPAQAQTSAMRVGDVYRALVGTGTDEEKFTLLLDLGRRAFDSAPVGHFVSAAVPRRDVIRGLVPESATVAPDFKRWSGVRLKALKDLADGHTHSRPSHDPSRRVYDQARDTLVHEDRLIACHGAYLAARLNAEPWHIPPVHTLLYNDIANLRRAIAADSSKVTALFQAVEEGLSRLIPPHSLREIADGDSPVTFFSDLPTLNAGPFDRAQSGKPVTRDFRPISRCG